MLLGTYIVFPPVSVLGMAVFTQAFLRHTEIVTGADGLPIALVSWALVWLLVWRGISLTSFRVEPGWRRPGSHAPMASCRTAASSRRSQLARSHAGPPR